MSEDEQWSRAMVEKSSESFVQDTMLNLKEDLKKKKN